MLFLVSADANHHSNKFHTHWEEHEQDDVFRVTIPLCKLVTKSTSPFTSSSLQAFA